LEISIRELFVCPTIIELVMKLEYKSKITSKFLIPIKTTGNKLPLYIICGAGGTVFQFVDFVKMLDAEQPVYGLQQPIDCNELDGFADTIEGIAEIYISEILKQNPHGPYALSGHCLGGNIAFEMALQLKALGKEVAMLSLFDPYTKEEEKIVSPALSNYYGLGGAIKNFFSRILLKIDFEMFLLLKHPKQAFIYKIEKLISFLGINKTNPQVMELASFNKVAKVFQTAISSYKTQYFEGEILLFYAKDHHYFTDRNKGIFYKRIDISDDMKNSWKQHAKFVKLYEIDGDHSTMFNLQYATRLVEILQSYLGNADSIADENSRMLV